MKEDCKHGVKWDAFCPECELVGIKERLGWMAKELALIAQDIEQVETHLKDKSA